MDAVVRLSFSYCDIQLSNWRIDAGGSTFINNVQSHIERCAEVIQRASLSSPFMRSTNTLELARPYWLMELRPYIAKPRIMESLKDMAVSFHWSKPCSFDLFLWLLSETGFRITHINDEYKRYGQPSVFLTGSAHATESAPVVLRVHLYEKRND